MRCRDNGNDRFLVLYSGLKSNADEGNQLIQSIKGQDFELNLSSITQQVSVYSDDYSQELYKAPKNYVSILKLTYSN